MTAAEPVADGCHLVDEEGRRFLNLGRLPARGAPPPGAAGLLREAFARACARCGILARLDGDERELVPVFAGQENASPARIREAFDDELRRAGALAGERLLLHPAMGETDVAQAAAILAAVAARLRTLLIEHNSYLSGGLAFPFADEPAGVAARGAAIYRFPARAAVEVKAGADHIRIAFAAGELGEVTSSGFYLPTLFGGDFRVSAEYELGTWRPCAEDAACFALFAQDETSTRRYYAQRMSTGDGPHLVLASMADVLSTKHDVAGRRGAFAVERRGDRILCAHRSGEEWVTLGEAAAPPVQEMVLGAKVWSKLRCGGLEATIRDLRIDGRLAARQIPPVPSRQDPRSNPAAHA